MNDDKVSRNQLVQMLDTLTAINQSLGLKTLCFNLTIEIEMIFIYMYCFIVKRKYIFYFR
jgi:hypothetical protein